MIQSKSGASGSIFNQQLYLAVVSLNKQVSLTDFTKHTFAFLVISCEFLSRFCEHEGKNSDTTLNRKGHSVMENI